MADLTPFSTVDELEAFWRPLTDTEKTRATELLTRASNRLRMIGVQVGVDVDERAAESEAYMSAAGWVVMEAVKRAMLTPEGPPVESAQITAGPYSENYKYTNPSGDLWFKKSELFDLDLYGKQSLDSLSTSRTDIYGS